MGKASLLLLVISTAALFGAAACKEELKKPPVTGDTSNQPIPNAGGGGGGGDSGEGGVPLGTDAGGDAGACTDLPNTGAVVDQAARAEDVPAGTGGTIIDADYDLSEALIYQGAAALPGLTGNTYQGSIRVTGQHFERVLVFKSSAGATSETEASGTITPSGVNATIAMTCPAPTQENVTYSVTDTTLTLSNLITKESFVFTKKQ